MLLAVVVMVALLLIALSVAAPVVARQLQREKEIESQHRMNEYVRAIQLYQRKFPGQYPPSIKALENTNNIRFLRQVYVDPLTGKADYKLIHLGEQKTKIHVFFGQELDGLAANLGSAAGLQSGGGAGVGAPAIGVGLPPSRPPTRSTRALAGRRLVQAAARVRRGRRVARMAAERTGAAARVALARAGVLARGAVRARAP